MEVLLPLMRHEEYMSRILSCNLKRVYSLGENEDFTGSHYLYNQDSALERMERYIQAIETRKAPVFSMKGQVQFTVAPPGYVSSFMKTIVILEGGNVAD